ncbi:DUF934 domain-containing protein [Rickettsiales bacterium]|nr:DUF934 domain-containing protein [Rickettsiales bacterium]
MIINKDSSTNDFVEIFDISEIKENKSILFDQVFWRKNKEVVIKGNYNLGIKVFSNEPINEILENLNLFKLINFNFVSFRDGRPFSYARKIRENFKYKDKIRASGDILPDQYIFLLRCGFDSFEIKKNQLKTWRNILKKNLESYYQYTESETKKTR